MYPPYCKLKNVCVVSITDGYECFFTNACRRCHYDIKIEVQLSTYNLLWNIK